MNSARKVGEIFTAAGTAFSQLADHCVQFQVVHELSGSSQIRTSAKKKGYEESNSQHRQQTQPTQQILNKSSEVTLNMLNASENEVDVEGLQEDVKLQFGVATEEVTS